MRISIVEISSRRVRRTLWWMAYGAVLAGIGLARAAHAHADPPVTPQEHQQVLLDLAAAGIYDLSGDPRGLWTAATKTCALLPTAPYRDVVATVARNTGLPQDHALVFVDIVGAELCPTAFEPVGVFR